MRGGATVLIERLLAVMLAAGMNPAVAQNGSLASPEARRYSFSRPDEAIVRHLELNLRVDFERKILSGNVSVFFQNKTQTDKLYLDTRGLVIKRVTLGPHNQRTIYRVGDPVTNLGQPLVIDIQPDTKLVNIWYETSSGSDALQWLHPSQTAGGRKPFLYTQSEPIHARDWVPCQDDPRIRVTYRARIKVPPGMLALMSAENPKKNSSNGLYEFYMPQPIPSYLLALAVGDLEFRQISERCGVYADPAIADTAVWEFADIDSMLTTAEQLYGPYRWQRYDVLVLPPGFPLGGMENPRLTFATPTLLAGDRSLVSVIAHELGHSWAGNLVTNATWNDIWLNEGMATYIERRIIEAVYGRNQSEMEALIGIQDLKNEMAKAGSTNADTRLRPDYGGRNLDEQTSDIPYEKGYLFLCTLEGAVGRQRWDFFLRGYFDAFAFQSMTTTKFLSYLNERLFNGDTTFDSRLHINEWVYGSGLPPSIPRFSATAFVRAESLAKAFIEGDRLARPTPLQWSTQALQQFLRSLPNRLTVQQMRILDSTFGFSATGNSEILQDWFLHVIASQYSVAYPSLEKFLMRVGRLKYLQSIYGELAKTPEGMEFAKQVYAKARHGYHPIAIQAIDLILKWNE